MIWLFAISMAPLAQTQQEKAYTIVDPGPKFLQEKDPAKRIALLDKFVASHHPTPAVLLYVYQGYCQAYGELKNPMKVMEYADKLADLGTEVELGMRFNARYMWVAAYDSLNSDDPQLAANAGQRAAEAMKLLSGIPKPQNINDQKWLEQKTKFNLFLQAASNKAANVLKDHSERQQPN
ncbi:MAG TPA: hypothetical protein VEI73_06155 [Candidatus Acidoferrum sp.]|nr:hypothetical protein [Candidatus Acidoferrum sp.]